MARTLHLPPEETQTGDRAVVKKTHVSKYLCKTTFVKPHICGRNTSQVPTLPGAWVWEQFPRALRLSPAGSTALRGRGHQGRSVGCRGAGWGRGRPPCPSHRTTAHEGGVRRIVSGPRHWNSCQELARTSDPTGSCLLYDGLPPSCCVTLGKALPLSETDFPHM